MRIPHQIFNHRNRNIPKRIHDTPLWYTAICASRFLAGLRPSVPSYSEHNMRCVPAPFCSLQLQTWAYDLGSGVRFARSNLSASSLLNIEQGARSQFCPCFPRFLYTSARCLATATAAAAAGRPESRPALALPEAARARLEAARARLEAARARPGQRRARRLPRRLPRPRQAVRC